MTVTPAPGSDALGLQDGSQVSRALGYVLPRQPSLGEPHSECSPAALPQGNQPSSVWKCPQGEAHFVPPTPTALSTANLCSCDSLAASPGTRTQEGWHSPAPEGNPSGGISKQHRAQLSRLSVALAGSAENRLLICPRWAPSQSPGINAPQRHSAYSQPLQPTRKAETKSLRESWVIKVIKAPKSTGTHFHSSTVQLLFPKDDLLMRVTRVCSKKQSLLLLFGRTVDFWTLILSMENNPWNPGCQYKLWNSSANLQIPRKANLEHKANHLVIQFLHTELVTHLHWSTAFRWLFPGV